MRYTNFLHPYRPPVTAVLAPFGYKYIPFKGVTRVHARRTAHALPALAALVHTPQGGTQVHARHFNVVESFNKLATDMTSVISPFNA